MIVFENLRIAEPFSAEIFQIKKTLGVIQKYLSGFCQADAAGSPIEQLCPQFLLQIGDLMTDCRLRHIKFFCRFGKAQMLCCRKKIF